MKHRHRDPARATRGRPGHALAWAVLVLAVAGGAASARTMWPQPALGPSRSGAPEILFTFDDGPHERTTPRILAALRAHGIHAIFFTVGWRISGDDPGDTARRAVLRQVLAEGHVLGNHTWNHAHLCMGRREEAEREIDATGALLTALQGTEVVFFRAPYGSRCRRLEQMLAERGLAHLHWDMDAREYLEHDVATTRSYFIGAIARLQPGQRAVLLMHDTQPTTARALPEILDWLGRENQRRRERGEQPIRVLSWVDIARERLDASFTKVLEDSGTRLRRLGPGVARRLLAPLAGGGGGRTAQPDRAVVAPAASL